MPYIFCNFTNFQPYKNIKKACKINVFRCFTGFSEYRRRWDSNRLAAVFKNNGIQKRDDLYMLNGTKPTAIMLETFFCDSSADCALAEKMETELRKRGFKDAFITAASLGQMIYRVRVGAYGVKSNAEVMRKKLQEAGFDALIVQS